MARNFRELEAKMSPERRAAIQVRAERQLKQIALDELREARRLTQRQLGEQLGVNPAAVSRMERRTDMYVSTLRNFVRALGGGLRIIASFPEGEVEIDSLVEGVETSLEPLINHTCLIGPMSPAGESNEFLIRAIDGKNVEAEKNSNGNLVYIPIRRVAEVIPEAPGRLPTVVINGRIQWYAEPINRWRFSEESISEPALTR
jgi:transcriptional regulator with XRE-family HTH domain